MSIWVLIILGIVLWAYFKFKGYQSRISTHKRVLHKECFCDYCYEEKQRDKR